eukprot:Gb_40034 [translate_table: standard]
MLRAQASSKTGRHSHTLLAVLCGMNRSLSNLQSSKQTAFNIESPGICPSISFSSASYAKDKHLNAGEDRTLDDFAELFTAGHLEVQTLVNPTKDEFRQNLEVIEPDFVYFQGEQVTVKDDIGSFVWGDGTMSTLDAFAGLFGSRLPTLVYLEISNGGKLGDALLAKGIPYVIFWKNSVTCSVAAHFRRALLSVFQSSGGQTWDAFQFAWASLRICCAQNKYVMPTNGRQMTGTVGPVLLGDPPKMVYLQVPKESSEGGGSPGGVSTVKIFDEETDMRFLVCGMPCTLNATLLGALEDGLNALLTIEIRGSKLHNRASAPPPPLAAATFVRGVITMRCDLCTSSFARVSLLVSGSAQTCFDDKLLECNIKKELLEKDQLVHALTVGEQKQISMSDLRQSAAIADGATVFEVWTRIPTWAAQVLRQLAPQLSYRSLVALGIAGIQGFAVAAFQKYDTDRLLSFWKNEGKKPGSSALNQKLSSSLSCAPNWLQPPLPERKRIKLTQTIQKSMSNSCSDENEGKNSMKLNGQHMNGSGGLAGRSKSVPLNKKNWKLAAMKPIPHTVQHKWMPFAGALADDAHNESPPNVSTLNVSSGRQFRINLSSVLSVGNTAPSGPVTHHRKSGSGAVQPQFVLSLNPLPMKKHGCNRCPIQECSEEDFLKDVMQFLIVRGHTRLVPAAGLEEFPDAILNAKRLDLYNLYREVVSRGGFYVGNGINWKGQVFSKMRNHTTTNRMTGVGNTLKRHYETYLLEYELAHDDVDGECCILCHSSTPGDWVNCGICGEWAHFGCDRRTGLGAFKDYAKTDGLEYICPRCSASNFRALSGRKTHKSPAGFPS